MSEQSPGPTSLAMADGHHNPACITQHEVFMVSCAAVLQTEDHCTLDGETVHLAQGLVGGDTPSMLSHQLTQRGSFARGTVTWCPPTSEKHLSEDSPVQLSQAAASEHAERNHHSMLKNAS